MNNRRLWLMAIAALTLTACQRDGDWKERLEKRVEANASQRENDRQKVEREFALRPFEKISITGAYEVHYQQTDTQRIKVVCRAGDLRRLSLKSNGRELTIGSKNDRRLLQNLLRGESGTVHVYLSSPDLTAVKITGSGEFEAETPIDTDHLKLRVTGSGDISLGRAICDDVDAEVTGSGDIEVDQIDVNRARLQVTGSGDIEMNFVRADLVESTLTGSGDITLSGHVRELKKSRAGSGDYHTDNLVVERK